MWLENDHFCTPCRECGVPSEAGRCYDCLILLKSSLDLRLRYAIELLADQNANGATALDAAVLAYDVAEELAGICGQ